MDAYYNLAYLALDESDIKEFRNFKREERKRAKERLTKFNENQKVKLNCKNYMVRSKTVTFRKFGRK